jgi:hypothetical protein
MKNVLCPRKALTHLGNAVWTVSTASVLAVVFLALPPTTDGPTVLREVTHSVTCPTCALSSAEARAVRDAFLIRSSSIEDPAASDSSSE